MGGEKQPALALAENFEAPALFAGVVSQKYRESALRRLDLWRLKSGQSFGAAGVEL